MAQPSTATTGAITEATVRREAARRLPAQRRSRERVERMLAAAKDLIARKGSDAVRMSEVAAAAGVPIGSLYQFFPDKSALILALAERYNAMGRACIQAELEPVHDQASLAEAFARLTDEYHALFLSEPVMRDIWSGTQADQALRAIDLNDSRQTAALLAGALERVYPKADRAEVATRALVLMSCGEAALRLAISLPPAEGAAVVEAFKRMALRELMAF